MKRSTAILPAALIAVAALSGCSSNKSASEKTYEAVSSDPTPDLQTLYQRPVDVNNALTVTCNEDFRMFWEDLGRAFYVDRPSYLTREIVPRP